MYALIQENTAKPVPRSHEPHAENSGEGHKSSYVADIVVTRKKERQLRQIRCELLEA